jgi:hypothetical protein
MRNKPNYLIDKSPKKKSQEQEARIAKNGFVTPASGAFWTHKGDVSFKDYLVEAKRTDNKGMRITEAVLEKIFKEALFEGKTAGLELEFKNYYVQGIVYRKKNEK